jgi:Helix-turn-helix
MRRNDIRARIREFSLTEAEGPDASVIAALYRFFDEHNEAFWGGKVHPVPILITPPTSARAYADAAEFSAFGCRQQLRVRPGVARGTHNRTKDQGTTAFWRMRGNHAPEGRLRWLSDLVLHEMVHLWLSQIEDPHREEHDGHGRSFTDECNRIGGMLGLPEVQARRRKQDPRDLPISPDWPFCCRPAGMYGRHYLDLWEQVPAAVQPFDGLAHLVAAWGDERVTDAHRTEFLALNGLVRAQLDLVDVATNGDARAHETVAPPPAPPPPDVVVADDDEPLGSRVRDAIKAKGLSLAAASALTGVSTSFLSKVQNGKAQPSDEIRAKIATGLELPA